MNNIYKQHTDNAFTRFSQIIICKIRVKILMKKKTAIKRPVLSEKIRT